ncbi:MAG: glycoside hydrolase family 2 TIM barrel-domain containing protein [Lutimonas sp.]
MKSLSWVILICLMSFSACKKEDSHSVNTESKNIVPPKIRLTKVQGKYTLLVNNEPFYIKGAGLEFGQISAVAQHGGNSFRTWRTENGKQTAKEVLDEAQKHGLMVTMGIEVARERHGFDYNDEVAVKKQFERIKKEVMAIKDHPALMIWAIGNELNLRATNPKVWDAVNDLSKMIHEVDGNHLTTSTLAGISQHDINLLKERCADLDLLSFQLYGKIEELPQLIKDYGWEGPYMVTEWGATGHWEVPKTSWDVPIEENSTVKAANYLKRYKIGIESDTLQCIGSYVFLWGQKQERTPTWYGIFLEDGKETESVDVMHYIWNSTWPANRTPKIESFLLDDKTAYDNVILAEGKSYIAIAKIKDFEEDLISYSWEILAESTDLGDGGDYETRPEPIEGHFMNMADGELEFRAPKAGNYRLFVYADDGNNHAATANIPFRVN